MVKPTGVTIRAYDVGFGDCFLVTFHYKKENRSILIDFGSTGLPPEPGPGPKRMEKIAKDIRDFVKKNCGGQLHGVVATHRHKDHISGFSGKTGQIIEDLKPNIVIQPWTEDPRAQKSAKTATATPAAARPGRLAAMQDQYLMALDNMNAFSQAALSASKDEMGVLTKKKIDFLADDNLANRDAVERLARMGKNEYVRSGFKSKLQQQLPGVKVHVLGPPDLSQTETILKQRSRDKDEFWHFMQFWSLFGVNGTGAASRPGARLFPRADVEQEIPMQTRWFIDRANRLHGNQLLGIVRILDKAMNNTSVILLFEVGGKKLLFPGDAQIENWAFSLSKPKVMKMLSDVDVYKVGHHGSLNATPKTLWNGFVHKSKKKTEPGRLTSVVSTMKGKHGEPSRNTEVPRKTLIDALTGESHLHSTEALKGAKFFEDIPVPL